MRSEINSMCLHAKAEALTLLSAITALFAFVACQDSTDLGQISSAGHSLVVYSFPTEGDTVSISVSQVYPVGGRWQPLHVDSVVCRTNGTQDRIVSVGDTTYRNFTIARYIAIGRHRCGDRIDITVGANGMPVAWGTTVIPGMPSIDGLRLDTVMFRGIRYPMLRTEMRDTPTTPYYAVRAEARYSDAYRAETVGYLGPLSTAFVTLNVEAEPLFAGTSKADIDLGTIDSDFYANLYTFGGASFEGGKATLHLYIDGMSSIYSAYRSRVLALSAEYSAMLGSLNSNNNNDFGRYGLAFVYSTYTNVHGGYGCIGAYAEVCGEWQH